MVMNVDRNYGCTDSSISARECLINKTASELVDGIPWVQYPRWDALSLVDLPMKGDIIGAVLTADGLFT